MCLKCPGLIKHNYLLQLVLGKLYLNDIAKEENSCSLSVLHCIYLQLA